MRVLVGRAAARFWISDFRVSKDIDWWSTEPFEGENFDISVMTPEILSAMEHRSVFGGVVVY